MKSKTPFISLVIFAFALASCGPKTYTVTFDTHGGNEIPAQTVKHGQKIKKPANPIKLGYSFVNWTNQGNEWSFVSYAVTEDMTLDAQWDIINYSITYNLNGGSNSEHNPATYTIEDNINLQDATRTGYTFEGWFDDNNNQITSVGHTIIGDLTLNACWSANLNNLSVASSDETKGTATIESGSGYSGESITVVATPIGDCVFKGWYHESTKVSGDATYTFTMPANAYYLVARFFTKTEEEDERAIKYGTRPILSTDGKTVTYGLYPQKHVNDSALISSLNTLSTPESNGWYLYNDEYYAKLSANPYHDSEYEFDDGVTIVRWATYWFKCEPITWNILTDNFIYDWGKSAGYYLLSSVLLDAHCYYNSNSPRTINEKTIYPNNYQCSDIRTWLNNDFYNSAFALGNEYIQTTYVDNSAETTNSSSNSYACNDTQDKVFLPSYQDYINSSYGFSTSTSFSDTRYCKTTDWARARGVAYSRDGNNNGAYWTRSPYSEFPPDGVEDVGYLGSIGPCEVYVSDRGVRPSISFSKSTLRSS